MLDQQQDTWHASADGHSAARGALYHRPMPGGGYVDVEMDLVRVSDGAAPRVRGRVILERRGDHGRRIGHRPPVVSEVTGADVNDVMAELFRVACDNAALARSMMRWQSAHLHDG